VQTSEIERVSQCSEPLYSQQSVIRTSFALSHILGLAIAADDNPTTNSQLIGIVICIIINITSSTDNAISPSPPPPSSPPL
jgi:hypothetical protein